jgi:hypothetical protein
MQDGLLTALRRGCHFYCSARRFILDLLKSSRIPRQLGRANKVPISFRISAGLRIGEFT